LCKAIIEQEPNTVNKLKNSSSRISALVSELNRHQTTVMKLVRDEILIIKNKMRKDNKCLGTLQSIRSKYSNKLEDSINRVIINLNSYSIHDAPFNVLISKITILNSGFAGGGVPSSHDVDVSIDLFRGIVASLTPAPFKDILNDIKSAISDKKSTQRYRNQFANLLVDYSHNVAASKIALNRASSSLGAKNPQLIVQINLVKSFLNSTTRIVKSVSDDIVDQIKDEKKSAEDKNLKPEEI
jgi:hypothetical protein